MPTSKAKRRTDIPEEERDEEAEAGRPPIDEDVEGALNAALPEPPDREQEPARESS